MKKAVILWQLMMSIYACGFADSGSSLGVVVSQDLMPRAIFREYDVRGKVGSELKIDQMYDLTRALAVYIKQQQPDAHTVAIGMDGRLHSQAIKEEVVRGFLDSGMDVTFVGLCHSPAVYFAMHTRSFDAGIMITASHNPKEYNGLKICLGTASVWGQAIQEIYTLYSQHANLSEVSRGEYKEESIMSTYVEWLVDHFQHLRGMNLSAVIDCGNGAAGAVIPSLVEAMEWKNVSLLFAEVDGNYPNHEADPVVLENMLDVKRVLDTTETEIGIGLDGDADRMAPMTKSGILVPGDRLLSVFARAAHLPLGSAIVCDIKSSAVLLKVLQQIGLQGILSPSGHSIIKDNMKKYHSPLGGEISCHFFFNDRYFGYDDGVYAMLRLFETVQDTSLDQLLEGCPPVYTSTEYRIPCEECLLHRVVKTVKEIFLQKEDADCITIDGVRASMPYGWGLIRASNTQPVLSMRFESETLEGLNLIKMDFIKAMESYFDAEQLKETLL